MDTNDEKKVNISEEIPDNEQDFDIEEYYDENADREHLKKYEKDTLYKKYTKSKNSFVISCLIFAVILALLFGPVFKISEISVTGNNQISRDAIIAESDLSEGDNILKADINGAKRKIASIPFVYDVQVKREFPSKISITVVECIEVGYMNYLGNYVGVSSFGKVLEISKEKGKKQIPVITGVELDATNIGENLVFTSEDASKAIMEYFAAMENCKILSQIKSIDMKDINDVKLTLSNDILVKMGQADKISYKFAYLEKVFAELDGQRGGVLDVSDPDNSVVYRAS